MNKLLALVFAWTVVMAILQSTLHPIGIQLVISDVVGVASIVITIVILRRFGWFLGR